MGGSDAPLGSPAASLTSEARPAEAPRRPDPALDLLISQIAGLPDSSAAPAAWQIEAPWQAFSKTVGKDWTDFDTSVLEPMKTWAEKDLRETRRATGTVFYAFGGPDFVTAYSLFPEATRSSSSVSSRSATYPVSTDPRLAGGTRSLPTSESSPRDFSSAATLSRRDERHLLRGRVDGALPVVAFFLGRGGYSVVDVRAPRGSNFRTRSWPFVPPSRRSTISLLYLKPGDPRRNVYYFSCDLGNKSSSRIHPSIASSARLGG